MYCCGCKPEPGSGVDLALSAAAARAVLCAAAGEAAPLHRDYMYISHTRLGLLQALALAAAAYLAVVLLRARGASFTNEVQPTNMNVSLRGWGCSASVWLTAGSSMYMAQPAAHMCCRFFALILCCASRRSCPVAVLRRVTCGLEYMHRQLQRRGKAPLCVVRVQSCMGSRPLLWQV